jgi:galactokinase
LDLDGMTIARLSQRVENEFVGARVGLMDPAVSSMGELGNALFLDTRNLTTKLIPMPTEADLMVISSGVRHQLAGGDYNTRRAECESAAAHLGVRSLRDLAPADAVRASKLPDPLQRRVRHVMTENQRVLDVIAALERGDMVAVGEAFNQSHASQRDDYEVSVLAVDKLVEIAQTQPEVYGARLTGGGFGGSIVALAHRGTGPQVATRIAHAYQAATGNQPQILVPA